MKNSDRQAFLILTDKSSPTVIDLFTAIQNASQFLGETVLAYHRKHDDLPEAIASINSYIFTDEILFNSGYSPFRKQLVPGSSHFPLLQFYLRNPDFSHYWLIEDDVRFNGAWSYFFNSFSADSSDFIASHIRSFKEEARWPWWNSLRPPRNTKLHPGDLLRSFNPIFRVSNRGLQCLHDCLRAQWRGHNEVLLATLLQRSGLKITDFGGEGDFVPPGFTNRFYTSSRPNPGGLLLEGTMRYRPVLQRVGSEVNKLYHPVKDF